MSIRHRITLLVILTFLAISSIGGYAIFQSRKNASEVKLVTEGVVPSALASADLVSELKDVQLATMTLVTAPDDNVMGQAKDVLVSKKKALQDAMDLQSKQAGNDVQRGLVRQARESLANYFSAIDDTMNFKLNGQADLAQATLFANVAQYQTEMEQIVETLRVEKSRSKDSAIENLNLNLAHTVTAISIVTAVMVVVLAAFGVMLYRQIARPIGRMQSMMSEIATSQDFTRRVPVDRMDEIGQSIVAFNAMIEKIQQSLLLLKQKTNDIQSMLQNMPQGILTITAGNVVHPEYSAYLETILDTRDIAGRDFMDLVFKDSNVGADALAQIEAVGGACIGEDLMNFEFNSHLMIGEIEKRLPDGRVKILDLSWSPITGEGDIVERLMLCVRDVTELRKLAAEANEQKRELEIIGEILSVSQEKFHEFIVGAIRFVDENELIIREHTETDGHAINQLFRNMHTIKGNARTYGLQHVTNVVHTAEQTYEELRKPRPRFVWDQRQLLEELAQVREVVERYARINEVSLGRKGPGRRGSVERYLMVDKDQILETLHRLETVNTANLHELVSARDEVRKTLRLLGTERIEEMLAGVFESLPSLAEELGKPAPTVRVQDNGFVVRSQAGGLLKNVFMHLIRNAVDHGLESSDVRLAQGKPAAGTITLAMKAEGGMLNMTLADDGRGLALARIREVAVQKGLIGVDQVLSDEETAQLIFRPGFSTADKITEVSGRGVGMDAVQDFVKREHGQIEIQFTDQAAGAAYRQFRMVVCLPESYAVEVDELPAKAGVVREVTAAQDVPPTPHAQPGGVELADG